TREKTPPDRDRRRDMGRPFARGVGVQRESSPPRHRRPGRRRFYRPPPLSDRALPLGRASGLHSFGLRAGRDQPEGIGQARGRHCRKASGMKAQTIERIYALSPLQEGILFHTLSAPDSSTYFEQFSFTLNGDVDVVSLERAWQAVIDRHAVLRSSFHWKELEKPFQVVHWPVKLPFGRQDWSALSFEEQQDQLKLFLQTDRDRDFDLSNAPLMRMVAIRMAPAVWQLVISFHHVLLDGWSVAIVFREAARCYEAYCQGHEPSLEPVRPFEDYIAWLQQQDFGKAKAFWTRMLEGYLGPAPISVDRAPGRMVGPGEPYESQHTMLSRETTAAL